MLESKAILSEYELERGKPMPSKNHAIIQANLLLTIQPKYLEQYRILPEISLKLPLGDRVPDLAIYPPLDYVRGEDEVRMSTMPVGVIEILSPTQSVSEVMRKRGEYFLAGVRSYWIVLPDLDTIYVFRSPEDYDVFYKKEMLKDASLHIEVSLEDIFR